MQGKASVNRLQLSNFKLDALLRITLAINENTPVDQLLEQFRSILCDDLNIGKILMFSYNQKWERILMSGVERRVADGIRVENDLQYYRQITNLTATLNPNLALFDTIIPVYHHDRPIAYVIIGDIDEECAGMSPTIKHLSFIQTLANIIVVAIENRNLFNENVRQEAMKKELELASRMQTMLIPNASMLPNNNDLHVSAYYLPHFDVGGDYYDWIKLSDNQYCFCIADVSGKGISAALLMSNFQANLRALSGANLPISDVVNKLNDKVLENVNGEKFITLFIAYYNTKTRKLTYVNAGHNPPILFDAETGETQQLTLGCMGVGMLDTIPKMNVGELVLPHNSKILCFTDGAVEIENPDHQAFGTEPIERIISTGNSISTDIDRIVDALYEHKGPESEFFDDITILGVEFK